MLHNKTTVNSKSKSENPRGVGSKLLLFVLGGGIGAAIALLFAPKPGRELRQDIADAAARGRDETLDAANRVKHQSLQYFEAAKQKGGEVLDSIAEDAEKISGVVGSTAKRISGSIRSR